jgi:hypothetical protein
MLIDERQGIKIASRLGQRTLLSLVKSADKGFRRASEFRHEFGAVNDQGYRVEFITQGRVDPMEPSAFTKLLQEGDLHPVQIHTLKWLMSSPEYSEIVFDEQGMPLRVTTVDPRAFLLHKWYASRRDDRSPAKRLRDAAHARSLAKLLLNEIRQLEATESIARLFPDAVIGSAVVELDEFSL